VRLLLQKIAAIKQLGANSGGGGVQRADCELLHSKGLATWKSAQSGSVAKHFAAALVGAAREEVITLIGAQCKQMRVN